jgi:nucleotide-binding universal stress UspA family protein
LEEALRIAKDDQPSALRLVHVIYWPIADSDPGASTQQYYESCIMAGRKVLGEAEAQAINHGIKAEVALLEAGGRRVDRVILEEATRWGADLIVLGTHGRHGVERFWFGSVAEGVARGAAVPVLFVRTP